MRIFFNVMRRDDTEGPVQNALKAVCSGSGHTVVDDPAQAELIVTDSAADALGYLKDYEDAKVLIAIMSGADAGGARSLAKAFSGRVEYRPVLDRDGEQNIVHYLMALTPKEAA